MASAVSGSDHAARRAERRPGPLEIAESLLTLLEKAGHVPIDPGVLQDASPFLDHGGEELRNGLHLVGHRGGAELCLRPEFTIPICRAYLASHELGAPALFSYCGPAFRVRTGELCEFVQAGFESFGRSDTAQADADSLALALDITGATGAQSLRISFGDVGLLASLLDALRLPPSWQRRLKRGLDRGERAADVLAAAPNPVDGRAGVLAALAGADAEGARALVDDLLTIAGLSTVGGRTTSEIADRFLKQVSSRSAPPFGEEQRAVLERFLSVPGDPDTAVRELRLLANEAGLDMNAALDVFEARTDLMAANGIDLHRMTFSGAFGRNLDYYTGFVFEGRSPDIIGGPVFGGGRYDGLAQSLGGVAPVPAVGVSIWVARLGEARREEQAI